MVSLYDAILDAANGGLCALADLSGRLKPPEPLASMDLLEPARQAFRNFVAGTFCDKPPLPPSEPFFGGQCPVSYDLFFNRVIRYWGDLADTIEPGEARIQGPLFSARAAIISSGGGTDVWDLVVETPQGIQGVGASVNVGRVPGIVFAKEVLYTDLSLARVDGQPDNCGDPGPITPDYRPEDFTRNTTIFYTNNEGNEYALDIRLVYAPAYLNANLEVNIPVKVSLNPSVNPQFNNRFDFQVEINLSRRETTYKPPGDTQLPPPKPPIPPDSRPDGYETPDAPPPPPDIPEPPPIPPERRTRRVIKAALVTVIGPQTSGKVGVLSQNENPDIAIPNYGFVSFLCRASTGSSGWTPDQPVKSARCFIPCPWEGGAFDVKGTPQPGINFVVTPVYVEVPVAV